MQLRREAWVAVRSAFLVLFLLLVAKIMVNSPSSEDWQDWRDWRWRMRDTETCELDSFHCVVFAELRTCGCLL